MSKARIVADAVYPNMWRVAYPDGSLSDMVNLSRAKDAIADYQELGGERRRQDRVALLTLLAALDASETTLRRDGCGDWAIFGANGHIYADGVKAPDGTWHLAMYPGKTSRAWTNAKRRLSFAQVRADCEAEGSMVLDRLPTGEEAAAVRDVLGIRKRRHVSPEGLAALRAGLEVYKQALPGSPMRPNGSGPPDGPPADVHRPYGGPADASGAAP